MAGKRKVEVEIISNAKGDGFRESERQATRWSAHIGAEGDKVSVTLGDSGEKGGKGFREKFAAESERGLSDRMSGLAGGLMRAFGKELGVTAKPTAATVATAFSASFLQSIAAGLASGAAKLAHGFAAGLALLPAAAITAAVGMGVLKIALSGVGDALSAGLSGDTEAFNEALKGMAPAAQEFARGLVSLRGELAELKGAVQESFFSSFSDSIRPLGELYLPMVQGRLAGIAGDFGSVGQQLTTWLQYPKTAVSIAGALDNMGISLGDVSEGAIGLARAFLPLVTVGASFLPGLTGGFDQLTNRLAAFMIEAERSGRLRDFISDGLSGIGDLIQTAKQLGRIFGNIGSIFSTAFSGMGLKAGGLLDKLESLTEKAEAFFKSSTGGKVMSQVMAALSAVINNTLGTLQRLGGMLGRVFAPIMPGILEFVEAFFNLKSAVLDVGLDALEPVLMGIAAVLGGVVLPALTGLANWLTDNRPVLQGVAIAIGVLLVPAFVAWAISAGTAAVATLLAMAPIILLGAAIAGLAALVIIHFDTIKRWISNVWTWVKDNWPLLLAILTGPFGLAVLAITKNWQTIKDGATAAKDWVVGIFNSVVDFVVGLPGRIASAAAGLWNGLLNGLAPTIRTVQQWINRLIESVNRVPGFDIPSIPLIGGGRAVGRAGGGGSVGSAGRAFADGGIVRHRPGGITATIGEGRHDEGVFPLPSGWQRNGFGSGTTVNVSIGTLIGAVNNEVKRVIIGVVEEALAQDQIRKRGIPL